MLNSNNFDFSLSGFNTAEVNLVHSSQLTANSRQEIASAFHQSVVDVLVKKTISVAEKFDAKSIVVGGGVAANEVLRSELIDRSRELSIPVFFPQKNLSVDNGAMIAAAAFYNFKKIDPLKLSANPALHFS